MAANFISDLLINFPTPGVTSQTGKSPLNSLYKNPYYVGTYQYPRDLASNPARNHYIVFECYELQPNSPSAEQTAKVGRTLSNLGVTTIDELKSLDYNKIKNKISDLRNKTTNAINDPYSIFYSGVPAPTAGAEILKNATQDATEAVLDFAAVLVSGQPKERIKETIALYIPDTLNVNYSTNYSDVSTTEVLGKPYMYAQIGASLYDKFKQYQSGASSSEIVSNVLSDPILRSFVTDKLSGKFGTGNLTGLSLNALAQAFNPQLQMLFSGIGFRSFQFDFTFTPYNQEEAEQVKKIIQTFKYRAAPEITSNGIFSQSLFMKIPDRFKIKFFYKNAENTNIHKIGTCVLTSINVDYAPIGWATYGDGTPVQTKLTLNFQEIEIIDKNKIGDPSISNAPGGY